MATIKRVGFGQVEPNHLSAQRNGQVYAQLPCTKDIKIPENGQFVKYDYANSEVNFTGAGEWMLVMNEVKLYDDFWREYIPLKINAAGFLSTAGTSDEVFQVVKVYTMPDGQQGVKVRRIK